MLTRHVRSCTLGGFAKGLFLVLHQNIALKIYRRNFSIAQAVKQTLIRSVLINGMCLFADGTRAATAARKASVELDGKYKRLRRLGAKLAHKAQWHKQRNAPIYASAECCPTRSGRRGFPQIYAEGGTAVGETREEGGILFY